MSTKQEEHEAEIVKFPGIASISLSITPLNKVEDFDLLEAIVRVYDENNEQIMRQKARSLHTIAKNLKLFIQNRTNLPINDRRMSVWFASYLTNLGIKLDEEQAYQIIKLASQALEKISRVNIEGVESTDLVSIETDVLANTIELKTDRLLSEDQLYEILEKNQSPVTNKVVRKITYKNSGGVEHKDSIKLDIHPGDKILEHKLVASFKNETEHELTHIVLSDIIPYVYRIISIDCKGSKYSKSLLDDGLKITWKIDKLASGEETKVFYTFEKRIARTILIRKGEEIRIVQDYNSIEREEDANGKTILYVISEVINLLPVSLDEMIIRDLVPSEMRIKEESLPEDIHLIDFGQLYGTNYQTTKTNVETGVKFLQRYDIIPAPLLWKLDFMEEISVDDAQSELITATKIIEQTTKENIFICTLLISTPIACVITNELESGLSLGEVLPPNLAPSNRNKMTWEVSDKLSVSMILKGTLSRQPTPLKITINGKEYVGKENDIVTKRESLLISLPFNHVALYRKMLRE